jgi:tetratricopeptide (TPR) repeat protein
VKFLEYAIAGVVPVVRRLAPYRTTVEPGVTGFLYDDAAELIAIVNGLVEDDAERRAVAERARAYVQRERREDQHSVRRLDWYRSLVRGLTDVNDPKFDALCRACGVAPDGRQATLEHGEYETLVLQALARGQLEGQRAEALACLQRAALLEPLSYQPHLFGAGFSHNPTAWLSEALRLNPSSIGARVLLADHLARGGKLEAAVQMLLGATELCPSYDEPYLAAARMLRDAGHEPEAKEFASIALALRQPLIDLYQG